jgi:hypothetical protein
MGKINEKNIKKMLTGLEEGELIEKLGHFLDF